MSVAFGLRPKGPSRGQTIETIKSSTDLLISVHCGLGDLATARDLTQAGEDHALVDVIGDNETYQTIYRAPFGVERIDAGVNKLALPFEQAIARAKQYGLDILVSLLISLTIAVRQVLIGFKAAGADHPEDSGYGGWTRLRPARTMSSGSDSKWDCPKHRSPAKERRKDQEFIVGTSFALELGRQV